MMKTAWAKMAMLTTLFLATGYVSSCDRPAGLEVRTFRIEHLRPNDAINLIDPYVYGDREGAPGAVSTIEGAITVRETADNLERISRVLAEFDRPQPDMRLRFQLIEADGFTDSDASIAAVETELRKIFQFRGYRLAGETFVSATDGSDIQQGMRASDGTFSITGAVYRVSPGVIRLESVTLWGPDGGPTLQTTVTIRPGQTVILGSSPKNGSTATLLLTVRAEETEGPA